MAGGGGEGPTSAAAIPMKKEKEKKEERIKSGRNFGEWRSTGADDVKKGLRERSP